MSDDARQSRRTVPPQQERLLEGWLTIPEAMSAFGYETRASIYNLMLRGLPYAQVGHIRLIPIEKARDWIAAQVAARSLRPRGRPRASQGEIRHPGAQRVHRRQDSDRADGEA